MALPTAQEAKNLTTTYITNKKNTFKTNNSDLIDNIGTKIEDAANIGNHSCQYIIDNKIDYETLITILIDADYKVKSNEQDGIITLSISWVDD